MSMDTGARSTRGGEDDLVLYIKDNKTSQLAEGREREQIIISK